MHCAKLIPGHDNTYIRNRFSLGAPLNIMYIYNLCTKKAISGAGRARGRFTGGRGGLVPRVMHGAPNDFGPPFQIFWIRLR